MIIPIRKRTKPLKEKSKIKSIEAVQKDSNWRKKGPDCLSVNYEKKYKKIGEKMGLSGIKTIALQKSALKIRVIFGVCCEKKPV